MKKKRNFVRIFLLSFVIFISGSVVSTFSEEKGQTGKPPVIRGVPDITVDQNSIADHVIDLWRYTNDPDTPVARIIFNVIAPSKSYGEKSAHVTLDMNRYINVSPDTNWTGSEEIIVEANDGKNVDYDLFRVTIQSVEAGHVIEAEDQSRVDRKGEWIESSRGDSHFLRSNREGDSLSLKFEGSYVAISFWGKEFHQLQRYYEGPKYELWTDWKTYEPGTVDIKIDGETHKTLNMSQANRQGWTECLVASTLEATEHELEIVIREGYIHVDKIRASAYPLIEVNSLITDEYQTALADIILKFSQENKLIIVLRTGPDGKVPTYYGLKKGIYDLDVKADSNPGYGRNQVAEENLDPQRKENIEIKEDQSHEFNFALSYTSPEYRSLGILKRPVGTIPSIVKRGDILSIECQYPQMPKKTEVFLFDDYHSQSLEVVAVEHGPRMIRNNSDEGVLIRAHIPKDIPDSLYSLRVILDGKEDAAARAVKIIPEFKKEYRFIQLSDLHVRSYKGNRANVKKFLTVAEEVNLLSPEFVVMTGDVTDSGTRPEYLRLLKALQELDVPTFVIPGNHDNYYWWFKYFYTGHDEYDKYFGQGYCSFPYGKDRYIFLNTRDYERIYDTSREGVHSDQWHWLLRELESATQEQKGLICMAAHYDFTQELPEYYEASHQLERIFQKYAVDLFLYGHAHRNHKNITGKKPTLALGTGSTLKGQYRLIEVKDSKVVEHPAFVAGKQKVSYSGKNDGTEESGKAVIKNGLDRPFKDLKVRFLLKNSDKGYKANNGEIVRIQESLDKKKTLVVVSVDLPPQGEATVNVVESDSEEKR